MVDADPQNDRNMQTQPSGQQTGDELDAAGKSLSEALRVSFITLKIIMVVLVVIFLASGFRTVGSDEQALVLRFGKIRGVGEDRTLEPGLHWVFPYPIDEIVRIPVKQTVNLPVEAFWYSQKSRELLGEGTSRVPEKLDPVKDGYCITRGERQSQAVAAAPSGSDYNIVHCKWQLQYQIDDPERFFGNVFVDLESIPAGQNYADVVIENVRPLLESMVADAVATTMVNYTIDDVLFERAATVTQGVRKLLQERLDGIDAGIRVISVQLTDKTWPRQVNAAFQASIKASQDSQKTIRQARTYAEKTLNEAAGPVGEDLFAALQNETMSEEEKERLWSDLAGTARQRIDEALAYKTEVVEKARANAAYLYEILPEYRKRPELVIQEIYLDAIQRIRSNADEVFVIPPNDGTAPRQLWIQVSKIPSMQIKPAAKQ
jgi:membrane protease subunit HflK